MSKDVEIGNLIVNGEIFAHGYLEYNKEFDILFFCIKFNRKVTYNSEEGKKYLDKYYTSDGRNIWRKKEFSLYDEINRIQSVGFIINDLDKNFQLQKMLSKLV